MQVFDDRGSDMSRSIHIRSPLSPKFSTFNYSFLLTGAIVCVKKKTGA